MTDALDATAAKPGPADLIEIFYAPSAVFARRREGQWGMPYVAVVVIGLGLYFATKNLIQPVIDGEISRNVALVATKNHLTPEQVASATSLAHTFANVGIVAALVIGPLILALLLWIVGSIAKVPAIGKTALAIAVFSVFPSLLKTIVAGIEAAVLPDTSITSAAAISLSPARFFDPVTWPGLTNVLQRFDIFLLWTVFLTGLGVRYAAGGTKKQAWITAVGVWVILSLPALWSLIRG